MPSISAQIKIDASIDFNDLLKSKLQLLVLKDKKWRPLFQFTAKDFINIKKKGKRK
ncbi:MAG TPA: hypothetical protein VHK86_08760 [Nitrososphaera sp.]|jgi:hypothetical protein|nr:hypothetical protein [Nitrososphaera sp.]